MKTLEIFLTFADSVDTASLTEYAEEAQESLPVDFEQNGIHVNDVTFEIQEPPKKDRGDYFATTKTLHKTNVNVAEGEWNNKSVCLLQSGSKGNYHCVYLNDRQVKKLIAGLQGFLRAAALFLLCVVGINGQPLPDNPTPHVTVASVYQPSYFGGQAKPVANFHAFNRPVFYTGIGLLGGATAADMITTRQVLDRGGIETNPLYGPHPSTGKQIAINGAFFAAQSVAFYFTEHNRHPWVRWTGRVFIGASATSRALAAVCNAELDIHTDPNCKLLF